MNQTTSIHYAPLWRTAWRRLRQRPFQYILFILGVALGVAMMVAIDLANGSAQRAFSLSTDAIAGKTTHRIVGGPTGIDERLYTDLRRQGYSLSAPVIETYVLALDLGNQPMRLLGIDPFAEPPFRSYLNPNQAQADLSEFLTEANGVILSQVTADTYNLDLGDSFQLQVEGKTQEVILVGLMVPTDEIGQQALQDLIFADIATAQELLGMNGRLSHIDLIINDEATEQALSSQLPDGIRLEPAAAQSNTIQQMSAAFTLNLTALSLLALVVGVFLIYNTVTFSVVQRRPLFGVLRCLGVTQDQLFWLIMSESALLGLIGSGLGLLLGVWLGQSLVGLVTQTINDFYFVVNVRDVAIPPFSLLKGLLIGIGAALLAALPPALEAMRTTPASTLRRSTLERKFEKLMPWLWAAWLLLGSAGAFFLWVPGDNLIIAFVGLFALLIAFALLSAPLTRLFMLRLAPLMGRYLGPLGRMAPRDIVRSLSRTSVAIAALMTAVSVIVGVSIMVGSFRQTVTSWLEATLQADIYISPPTLTASRISGDLPADTLPELRQWPGVRQAVTARQVFVFAPAWQREVDLVAVDGDISDGKRPYAWIDGDPDRLWQRFLAGEGIMISEPLLLRENLSLPPEPVTLMSDQGAQSFPVLAVYYDYASDQGTLLIDQNSYRTLWSDEAITTMGLFLEPDVSADLLVDELQTSFAGRQEILFQSNRSIRDASVAIFDRTFAITVALQLLATIVAFIGVLSALMSLQLERAHELGILRATGMTLRQLWQLTFMETGLMGGMAGLMAMPTGYILAWVLIYIINVRSFGWSLQMNLAPAYFGQAFLVAVVAALMAGIYPAWRLGQMIIATAIRQE